MRWVGALVLAGVLALGSATRAEETVESRVGESLQRYIDSGELPGAVALVAEGDDVEVVAIGKANLEDDTPMADDTLFGIMSMTKPITATALMILVDEGKVSLDDPVEKYIPDFAKAKTSGGEPVKDLTIRHLLTHTSGLGGDQGCSGSLEATANALAAREFSFQPGEKWQYGPSLNVVGRIIEIVSGQPYEEFVSERILKPVGMDDTTFHVAPEDRDRVAVLYRKGDDGKSLVPAERWHGAGEPGCVPNPSGGLFSTARDMNAFYQMVLGGGEANGERIVSEDAVKEMTEVQRKDLYTGFTDGNGWGLGWCVIREPQGVTEVLSPGTFGHGGAYGTQGWVDPVKGRVFVLLIQRSDLGNSDGSDIRRDFQKAAVEEMDSAN